MKDIRLGPVITVLLLIVGSVWWFMTFERVTEPVYIGLKGAAREDPLLALRQLLKRSKMRLEEPAVAAGPAAKFDNLPAGGTLLLTDRRYILMSAERVNTIVAWVEAGGHLIVEAEYPGRPDPLLAAFGLGRKDLDAHPRLADGLDKALVGQVGRRVNQDGCAVGEHHFIFHRWGCGNQVQVVLTLQPLLDDVHVE